MNVRNEVVGIISEYLGIKSENIQPEVSLIEDLGADSLDCLQITVAIENKFDIEIPDADMVTLTTVEKIIQYVESKVIK